MLPTLLGLLLAAYLFRRADSLIAEGRNVLALVLCSLASTALVVGLKIDTKLIGEMVRVMSLF